MHKGGCFDARSTLVVLLTVHVAHSQSLVNVRTHNFRPTSVGTMILCSLQLLNFRLCPLLMFLWAARGISQRHVLSKSCAGKLKLGIAIFPETCFDSSLVLSEGHLEWALCAQRFRKVDNVAMTCPFWDFVAECVSSR